MTLEPDAIPPAERLHAQIEFVRELDKLKGILRQTELPGLRRRENSAEHSWHLAMMVLTLAEHANERIDSAHAVRLLLLHDVVEIDAGDAFIHDPVARAAAEALEEKAARRIFGLLPADQAADLRSLWDEFTARVTPEAKFAHALDRLIPILHNHATGGGSWVFHQVRKHDVIRRCAHMAEGSVALWEFARGVIDDADGRGYFAPA